MPSFTSTIEDYSPAIIYSPDWAQGSSQSDKLTSSYSGSSFFATNSQGGTASSTFNGTGIELFGAKRGNHGLYQVTIDGTEFAPASGQATDPGIFQTSLFSKTDLSQGLHTVVLQNQGNSGQFVDLDYITWHGNIGQSNEQLSVITVEDNDPSFVYSPNNAWSNTPDNLGFFSGSSGHSTTTPGASFAYTFQGDGVSLFGPVGPAYSPFSIQLNGNTLSFTAQKSLNASQVLLYHANSLGPGPHTLKLLVQPSATGQIFAIDYAQVYSTPSTSNSSSNQNSNLSGGAIAGLVIGLLIIAGILLAGLWWYLRRRRDRGDRLSRTNVLDSEVGVLPEPPPNVYPDISGPVRYEHRVVHDEPAPATFMDFTSTHTTSTHTLSVADDSCSDSTSRYASSTHHMTRSITNSTSPRRTPSGASSLVPRYSKGVTMTLPSSAGESLSGVPVERLQVTRMVVNGRPQDFGSVPEEDVASSSNAPLSQSYVEHHPPPDYHQATENFNG